MESAERPTVLITGIGIGAATARAFAGAGYRVVVTLASNALPATSSDR